ncbi:MAG: DUF4625 domain-containing protein [Flavobacteriales bacterium]|nr:DUF4625 domain-containing protein [Flavobacteriales bacterium]MBL6873491.1 DUF4625 domain-containing protein [Flavobacteriales bacterium]
MKNVFKILILSLLFAACSQENEVPTINSFTLDNSTIQKEEGALLKFSYSFSDDSGLNQFRVSVIDDFEDARLSSAPWNYDKDYDLSGTSSSDSLSIALPYPDLEPGRYKLTLIVQDIDGEETAESKTFYIVQP